MADTPAAKPDDQSFVKFIRAQGLALHAKDQPPASRQDWEEWRKQLRQAMFKAMGPFPDKPCDLEPKVLGILMRGRARSEVNVPECAL